MQKILVGTDTSARADRAVAAAAGLARANFAELVVLYVKPPLDAREVFDPEKLPEPNGYLERMRERFPEVKVRTRTEAGDPAERIVEVAEEEDVDTIVVGNRGVHGRRRWFLGSVPLAVATHAPTSVYIVDTRNER
jgi:nucleotide-binding universal stress UspA family protein